MFDKELKSMCFRKTLAHSEFTDSLVVYQHFKSLRSSCKNLNKLLFSWFIAQIGSSISRDPIFFWRFIRDQRKDGLLVLFHWIFFLRLCETIEWKFCLWLSIFSFTEVVHHWHPSAITDNSQKHLQLFPSCPQLKEFS